MIRTPQADRPTFRFDIGQVDPQLVSAQQEWWQSTDRQGSEAVWQLPSPEDTGQSAGLVDRKQVPLWVEELSRLADAWAAAYPSRALTMLDRDEDGDLILRASVEVPADLFSIDEALKMEQDLRMVFGQARASGWSVRVHRVS